MHLSPVPWKILSSSVGVGVLTDGWNLAHLGSDDREIRTFNVEVAFAIPFAAPPVVHLGLTGFDIDQRDSGRVTLKTGEISSSGFQATISTWAYSRIYAVEFNWVAIGA